jgi:hypothetical protein
MAFACSNVSTAPRKGSVPRIETNPFAWFVYFAVKNFPTRFGNELETPHVVSYTPFSKNTSSGSRSRERGISFETERVQFTLRWKARRLTQQQP